MLEDVEATLAAYADWMRSWGASQATIDVRVATLRPLLKAWGGAAGVTSANIEAWLVEPRRRIPADGRPCSTWTRATYHAHMKSLCDWLLATGRITSHPMIEDQVRSPRRPAGVPRPLSEIEARRVLADARGDTRTWLMLAMYAGLRAHEIAKIRGEDVSEDFIYMRGKGGVEAEIPTHPQLWEIAQQYPRRGYWFPDEKRAEGHVPRTNVSANVAALFRRCGVPRGSIHRARHLYATRLLREGVNIRVVQKLMRHSSVKTTAGYTAVDEDELRAAVNRLSA